MTSACRFTLLKIISILFSLSTLVCGNFVHADEHDPDDSQSIEYYARIDFAKGMDLTQGKVKDIEWESASITLLSKSVSNHGISWNSGEHNNRVPSIRMTIDKELKLESSWQKQELNLIYRSNSSRLVAEFSRIETGLDRFYTFGSSRFDQTINEYRLGWYTGHDTRLLFGFHQVKNHNYANYPYETDREISILLDGVYPQLGEGFEWRLNFLSGVIPNYYNSSYMTYGINYHTAEFDFLMYLQNNLSIGAKFLLGNHATLRTKRSKFELKAKALVFSRWIISAHYNRHSNPENAKPDEEFRMALGLLF